MGMASTQDIPNRPAEKSEWSMRRLFPFGGAASAFTKAFINVFDVLLGLCILFIGIAELTNKQVSWVFYVITILLLFASFVERRANAIKNNEAAKPAEK